MAKIVLINPNFEPSSVYKKGKNKLEDSLSMPRSLLCLGTYVQKYGHQVKILDIRLYPEYFDVVKKECQDADFVGFTVMTSQVTNALKLSAFIKRKINPNIKIIWGGIHSTLFTKQTCENEFIDYVVHGEGEETLLDIVNNLAPEDIKNLAYRKLNTITNKPEVIINERRDFFDLDTLPPLNYDLLELENYIYRTSHIKGKKVRTLPVITSRGCPHRCSFCIHVACKDQKYRTQNVDVSIKELIRLKEKYGIEAIKFAEDNFFVNRKRVVEMCNQMIEHNLNLEWITECRADYFRPKYVDDELLTLIKKAGCVGFTIGAESGSPRILELMKKDVTREQILFAAKQCQRFGLHPSFSFIVGLPTETKKDILMTVSLIEKVLKFAPDAFGGVNLYRPYPGGDLYDISFNKGKIKKPEKLTDWIKPKYVNLMTLYTTLPWNDHASFVKNLGYYGILYFFTKRRLRVYLKRNIFLGAGLTFFVSLAKLRWKFRFFHFPIDRFIFVKASRIFGSSWM
jgi:anaerobic magnesium-protoporphyrin IX monomethyl ester cyclase